MEEVCSKKLDYLPTRSRILSAGPAAIPGLRLPPTLQEHCPPQLAGRCPILSIAWGRSLSFHQPFLSFSWSCPLLLLAPVARVHITASAQIAIDVGLGVQVSLIYLISPPQWRRLAPQGEQRPKVLSLLCLLQHSAGC